MDIFEMKFPKVFSLLASEPSSVVNTADEASRVRYIGFILEEARKRDISSHLWGYREPFMIRDEESGAWIPSILEAMKLK